jgi:uncharacterized membrane protein YesL
VNIDPENRTLGGVSTLIAFIALNVVYLVACVPVITIGAATAALYEVMIRFSDHEQGRPLRDFFPSFVRNFRRASLVWLAFGVPLLALVGSGVFWIGFPSIVGTSAAILSFAAAAYLIVGFLYGAALVAVYQNTVRQTIKNALLLPAAHVLIAVGILIVPAALICVTAAFPLFGVIDVTIGVSVGAYLTAFLFRRAFDRHTDGP